LKRVIIPIAILTGAALVFFTLVRNPERLEAVAPEQALTTVRVAAVQPESVKMEVQSQGKVQASRRVNLSAAAAGPVSWVSPNLVPGGFFAADEAILRLDSSDFENTLARSQSSVAQANFATPRPNWNAIGNWPFGAWSANLRWRIFSARQTLPQAA